MSPLLGLDIATTEAKALILNGDGEVVGVGGAGYPTSIPQQSWSEQAPADWWSAAARCIRTALASASLSAASVSAIGITGQMHGLVVLDREGNVLRPAMLWNDQRTGAQTGAIRRRAGGLSKMLAFTGNNVLPGFTAPKLLWVHDNEPEVYARIAHVLLPKDYVRYRLTGEYATDFSDASGTAFFDVAQRCWSTEMLRLLDIPADWLPTAYESTAVCGYLSADAADQTGLPPGTPVVAGAGDQAAQAVGAGVIRPGAVVITIGTSGVVFAATDRFTFDPEGRLHAFCHAAPDRWHLMGVMLAAGGSLRWLRDTIGKIGSTSAIDNSDDRYEVLTREASMAPAGSDGLLFLPYLNGERTPYADPLARGAYVGLTSRHSRSHLIRAVMEGVAFGLRDNLDLVRSVNLPVREIRLSGGGAKSELWRQILADTLGQEVVSVSSSEGAARGSALLAGVATGVFASVDEAVDRAVRPVARNVPVAANVARYDDLYQVYRSLYPALQHAFHRLG